MITKEQYEEAKAIIVKYEDWENTKAGIAPIPKDFLKGVSFRLSGTLEEAKLRATDLCAKDICFTDCATWERSESGCLTCGYHNPQNRR